jgi:hypothetical protein
MHAIIAAIVAVLLSLLLLKMARKRRLLGTSGGSAATLQMVALALCVVGLVVIVIAWISGTALAWGPWLVWAGVLVYLVTAVIRATKKVV